MTISNNPDAYNDRASEILMDAVEFFGATLAVADRRAWEHLLVYCPRELRAPAISDDHWEEARRLAENIGPTLCRTPCGLPKPCPCENRINQIAAAIASAHERGRAEGRAPKQGVYVASKTKHAGMWKALRSEGFPVNSTWIDEAGPGESADLADLWRRCISEASNARAILVYRAPGDVLKGAWVELGAALACGVPAFAVGLREFTISHDPRIAHFDTLDAALSAIDARLSALTASPHPAQTAAARDVLAERERQMAVEGWTPEHDDKHVGGEMAQAAACYALARPAKSLDNKPLWPWSPLWWKPRDRRRNLVRAGSLILAEIERLDRLDRLSALTASEDAKP